MKAIKESRSLNILESLNTYEYVRKAVLPLLGIEPNSFDHCTLGSFDKKEFIGDIDIAVKQKLPIEEAFNILAKAGFEPHMLKGFNQIAIAVPVSGHVASGIAQIDLMFTDNINWCKWSYFSPDEIASKYKGTYRSAFLSSIISEMDKTFELNELGEVVEYEQHVMRFHSGIWKVQKSYQGKKGLIKTPKIIHEEMVTSDPSKALGMALGNKSMDDTTFENLWEFFLTDMFPYPDKRYKILTKYKRNLDNAKLQYPSEVVIAHPEIFGYVTIFFPGSFKPMHGGHLNLLKRYNNLTCVKKIMVLIGEKERDGMDAQRSLEAAKELTKEMKKIEILVVKNPTTFSFEFMETAEPGLYAMASSTKRREDFEKTERFVKGHQNEGKYKHLVSDGVSSMDLHVDSEPIYYYGIPISSTSCRESIRENNFEKFKTNYPECNKNTVTLIWNILIS